MHALRRVTTEWTNLTASMGRMYQSGAIRPGNPNDIFQPDAGDAAAPNDATFTIRPIVFNLPEAPGGQPTLFIALKGWLSFSDVQLGAGPMKTKSFGTEMGYFRRRNSRLEHVYGVHFDLDESKPGHPVFHAQVSSQSRLGDSVRELYRLEDEIVNEFSPKLGNIRIPSAQMDVFSVVVQICADHHLALGGAGAPVKAEFDKIRKTNSFFLGAAHRMSFLNSQPASDCYRSAHWYG